MMKWLSAVLSEAVLLVIGIYQRLLSPLLGSRCRFYPSCSNYARLAFSHLPPHKALFYSFWRILRCQPMSAGGEDFPPGVSAEVEEDSQK